MIYSVAKAILKNMLGITGYPQFVTFLVTWRCNGRCVFCDVWKKRNRENDEMTPQEIGAIFKQLRRIDVLRITGGEPFLRHDLAEMINAINAINPPAMIHLTTNGFLPERIRKTVNAIHSARNLHIKVSIDGVGEKHDRARGVKGAYENALETIRQLVEIREASHVHIGVNQAIIDEHEIPSYFELKEALAPYDVSVYPSIAFQPANALYSNDSGIVDPTLSFQTFGEFSPQALEQFMATLVADGKKISNLQEQIVDRYHLKGLSNRLVRQKAIPNPRCVALNNHLRLLPNGDVPICLYNGAILGNLRTQPFEGIWFGEDARQARKWVNACPGCWQSCESAVSAIYTGDIWRGLLY